MSALARERDISWESIGRGSKVPQSAAYVMACMRPWPCIGLSAYIVCRQGASKPVSHMSRTITILKGFFASLNWFAKSRRCFLLPMCN